MFHFYKKFVITTSLDVLRDPDDFDRKVDERVRYFKNIAKAFGIAYEQERTHFVDLPDHVRRKENVVAFGSGTVAVIRWNCMLESSTWERFMKEVNDYFPIGYEKHPMFNVYEGPYQ